MAIQFSIPVANAQLDIIEDSIGVSPILRILSGPMPASCATAQSGTVISTIALPSDWMSAASGGTKVMSGSWQDASADNSGEAAYFRILETTGTTCHLQGTVSAAGDGGDMIVTSTTFVAGQPFAIVSFAFSSAV